MNRLVQAAPAALLVFGLAASASAGPVPVASAPEASFQLAAAERASDKVERTKAWLKTKKAQTTRWVDRQKQKLKRIVD